MAKILYLPNVSAILFDLDGTLYRCPEYIQDGEHGEIRALAQLWEMTSQRAGERLNTARENLRKETGRSAGRGQTVLSFGIPQEWWNKIRNECYDPEKFLRPWPGLKERIETLLKYFHIAVVSNSPTQITKRVLSMIGLGELMDRFVVLGGDDALPKPDLDIYQKAAMRLKTNPAQCLSIGDRIEYDAWPAMRVGMGAVIVEGMADLIQFLDGMIQGQGIADVSPRYFDLSRLLQNWYELGEVGLAGVTGQAGGGKTTTAFMLEQLASEKDIPLRVLPLDCYFKKSSRERKIWLDEGKTLGPEEYRKRADQMCWWDFNRLQESLAQLLKGQDLHLRGVYNRGDHGEMTLDLDIPMDPKLGTLVVVEGVAIAHMKPFLDDLVYLHAPREVRRARLLHRDPHRVGPDAEERFRLTEAFELGYFQTHLNKADVFVDNGGTVPILMEHPPVLAEM